MGVVACARIDLGERAMKLTPERQAAFCAALAATGIVRRACDAVSITRQTAYNWRDDDPEFAAAWERALKIGVSALEDEAHRRAFEGTDEPVYYKGMECGSVRKYSDTLAIFLLKAHAPEKYRENIHAELTGAGGGPIALRAAVHVLSDDELARIAGSGST